MTSMRQILQGGWIPFGMALTVSLTFCFLVYPHIAADQHAVLDPDGYGRLGFGLWKHGALSYYPDTESTVARGPAYPALICMMLAATGGWWPGSVQTAQCVLFALVTWMIYRMGQMLAGKRAGFIAALIFAVYPVPIWFTSRIWVEILAMFLMTAFCLTLMQYLSSPRARIALLAGLILGIATLCKSTFLPFVIIAPLLVAWLSGWKRTALIIPLTAAVVVLPWTARNWKVSGHIVPVHVLTGAALLDGDYIVNKFWETPFSYRPQCEKASIVWRQLAEDLSPDLRGASYDYALDKAILENRLEFYADQPMNLLRKMAANTILFWFLGESPAKSLAIGILLLPLAILFAAVACVVAFGRRRRSVWAIPVALVFFYFAAHTPLNAVARYSVPLLPMMLACVVAFVSGHTRSETERPSP